jgi:GAF domain-containing protein
MLAAVSAFLGDLSVEVVGSIIAAPFLALGAWAWRKGGLGRWREWRNERAFKKRAPVYVILQLGYASHLRDVMSAFWRAHEDSPDRVRERIRHDVLEPIRGFLNTSPGEEIKIVWYRPTEEGKDLCMYEQVGHTPEGQAAMRLPIGGGLAGRAYTNGEWVESPNVEADKSFQPVEKSKAKGSIACVPIIRPGGQTTGVLSVMSSCQDAFWRSEQRYFEALAAAIAAIETLEQHREPADTAKQGEV